MKLACIIFGTLGTGPMKQRLDEMKIWGGVKPMQTNCVAWVREDSEKKICVDLRRLWGEHEDPMTRSSVALF